MKKNKLLKTMLVSLMFILSFGLIIQPAFAFVINEEDEISFHKTDYTITSQCTYEKHSQMTFNFTNDPEKKYFISYSCQYDNDDIFYSIGNKIL